MAVALADRIYILRMLSETSQSGAPGLFHAWVKNTAGASGRLRGGSRGRAGKGRGKAFEKGEKKRGKARAEHFAGAAVGRVHAPDKLMFKGSREVLDPFDSGPVGAQFWAGKAAMEKSTLRCLCLKPLRVEL